MQRDLESDLEYLNLSTELVRLQNWLIENDKRMVVIFEGRDSAGKGGAIMRFIRFLNPRFYRVIALTKPTDFERHQWYFQRYVSHLPGPGEIAFFDRSWYNRAVVEPVMGFCTTEQYELFMSQVNTFENMLIDDGVIMFKLWFSIDKSEQHERLEERRTNPLISWKLSTVDMQAQMKWDDFTHYKEQMFLKTGTSKSPWIVIKGNDKIMARKESIRYILNNVPYNQKGLTGESLEPNHDIFTIRSGK